jgi:methionyl-tRNA synthetase
MKKTVVEFEDFAKLDIRVGLIKKVVAIEKSQKLLNLTVDLGEDYGTVTILSGIAQHYTPEQLTGKKTFFIANLAPRPMMGLVSNGMLMATDLEGKPFIFFVDDPVVPGSAMR